MFLKSKSKNKNLKRGFTLIELLVAMMLFVVLLSIAVGGFIRALRTQRAITALMEANDNVSFIMEQIAREIRTGYNFVQISDSEFQFINDRDQTVLYRYNDGAIEKGIKSVGGTITYKEVTAGSVKISNFNVVLSGENAGDGFPPRVTLSVTVITDVGKIKNLSTSIQTTVSARILDS